MSSPLRTCLAALIAATVTAAPAATGDYQWNWTLISNPNWEIALTDFGYSDYLFDRTPGFEGREYLSGEWGAALGYQRNGRVVSPTWLEPRFSFPDWDTNSNYQVVQPSTLGVPTAQGLPTMRSIVSDGVIQVTQDTKFVDTLTGIAMGSVAASATGSGGTITSNRYVLQQTYTFHNVSSGSVEDLRLFQFLHGLNSQWGVYDNRTYGGPMGDYRYDITLGGDAQSSGGQYDYIGFHARFAPSAVEVGAYGTEGVDDHSTAKPSTGTHWSVEADALNGSDDYRPSLRWVSGAGRFDLGSLGSGQEATFDVLLTIRSGWQVGTSGSGTIGGTDGMPGSVSYMFLGSHSSGQFFLEFENEDAADVAQKIALGEFGALTFGVPGARLPLFDLDYDGSFAGGLRLTFFIDPSTLPSGTDVASLHLFHWHGGAWQDLGGGFDPATGGITVVIDSLSPFAVGAVPEPTTLALMVGGAAGIWMRRRRRAGRPG